MIKNKIITGNIGDDSISLIDTNYPYSSVTIYLKEFKLDNGDSISTLIKGEIGPRDIITNGDNNILILNSYDESLITVDLNKKIIISIVKLGRFPVCMKNLNNKIYILNCDSNSISIVDELNNVIIEEIYLDEKPMDLQIDIKENKVYIANYNGNSISILNIDDNSLDTIKIKTQPIRLIIDDLNVYILSYINNGITNYSCISTLNKDTNKITSHNIKGIYLDILKIDENNFLLTNPEDGCLYNFNNLDRRLSKKMFLGGMPCKIVWNNEKVIYITDLFNNQVIIFDLEKNNTIIKIKVGEDPQGIYLL